jgi:hypothetical protein
MRLGSRWFIDDFVSQAEICFGDTSLCYTESQINQRFLKEMLNKSSLFFSTHKMKNAIFTLLTKSMAFNVGKQAVKTKEVEYENFMALRDCRFLFERSG